MPPKPQVFKTPDGKEFSTRAEWRDYMMLTFYSFKNKVDEPEPLVKPPGSVDGQMFDIADCKNSTLVVLDQTEQVQIDVLENCRVFLGACASSIFIRNCKNCVFYTCCRQLRLREVTDCTFYIYSMAEVHIEFSSKLRFAPFNGGYAEQARHLAAASLDVKQNLWYDIYDHNDPGKTHANWSLLPEAEYEQPWFPAGPCEPAIPRTTPGSVKRADADAGMQSFSFQQMVLDAQQTTTAPPSAPASDAAAPPLPEAKTVPVAAPVPPAPPASNGDNDDSVITEIAKLFATLKAGNSLSEIIAANFGVVLPNGKIAIAAEIEVSASPQGREFVKMGPIEYSAAKDVAHARFWAKEGSSLSIFTAVFTKHNEKWLIASAHQSIVA